MIFEIVATIAIAIIAFGSLDCFKRQDRERAELHRKIKMIVEYLDVYEEEYLARTLVPGFGPFPISKAVIRKRYAKMKEPESVQKKKA